MNFPLSSPLGAGAGAGAGAGGRYDAAAHEAGVKAMQGAMESCFGKMAMSGVMGFGLGGVFGLFMASMSYDTPYGGAMPNQPSIPLKEQLRIGFKDMGTRSWSMAKNFGRVGGLFSGIECGVEGLRAKNDLWNSAASGFLTGGILARNAGPQAMALGGMGFAAFSVAIDAYMHQAPKDE